MRGKKPHPRKEEAVQRVRGGEAVDAVAAAVGARAPSVLAWCRAAGLLPVVPGPRTETSRRVVEELRAARPGTSLSDVARRCGVSRQAVHALGRRWVWRDRAAADGAS